MILEGKKLCVLVAVLWAAAAPSYAQDASDAAVSSVAISEDVEQPGLRTAQPSGNSSVANSEPSSGSRSSTDMPKPQMLNYGAILKKVKKDVPGDIVDVALKLRPRGLWTYEFTVLDRQGRSTRLSVNAQTAAIISRTRR